MSKKNKSDNEDFFMNADDNQISMIAEITTEPDAEELAKILDSDFVNALIAPLEAA